MELRGQSAGGAARARHRAHCRSLFITACRPGSKEAYLNPEYPELVAEYAGRLRSVFKGEFWYFTPLNEPRITAWYCGRLGGWPPYWRGWSGFVAVMLAIARGIVATIRRLEAIDSGDRSRSRRCDGPL